HPAIEDLLIPREDRLDCQGDVSFAFDNLFQRRSDKILTRRKSVVVPNPDKVGLTGRCQDFVISANRLKGLELSIELVDIFPRRRRMNFPDIRLNTADCLPLESRDLLKSLLRIRHSLLDLVCHRSEAKC